MTRNIFEGFFGGDEAEAGILERVTPFRHFLPINGSIIIGIGIRDVRSLFVFIAIRQTILVLVCLGIGSYVAPEPHFGFELIRQTILVHVTPILRIEWEGVVPVIQTVTVGIGVFGIGADERLFGVPEAVTVSVDGEIIEAVQGISPRA